jgi:2-iminobutanoate/2-iminopropanoate deaminase
LAADFAAQTRLALENLRQILRAAGMDLEQVAAVDVFLTDMDRFSEFNGIYSESFPAHRPARAVVAVRALPRGAMVEIKCIACFP